MTFHTALPLFLQTASHLFLSRKLFEFPSQPLYTNGKHLSWSLLKCHRILKLEQLPAAMGSSQKSAVVRTAVEEQKIISETCEELCIMQRR